MILILRVLVIYHFIPDTSRARRCYMHHHTSDLQTILLLLTTLLHDFRYCHHCTIELRVWNSIKFSFIKKSFQICKFEKITKHSVETTAAKYLGEV